MILQNYVYIAKNNRYAGGDPQSQLLATLGHADFLMHLWLANCFHRSFLRSDNIYNLPQNNQFPYWLYLANKLSLFSELVSI